MSRENSYDALNRLSATYSQVGGIQRQWNYSHDRTKCQVIRKKCRREAILSVARLTGTSLRSSTNTLLNYHGYSYNLAAQRTNQTRTDASYVRYTYDGISEVKSARGYTASGTLIATQGYLYDAAQNLNNRTNNGTTTAFGVNLWNQLETIGSETCTYDNNGNMTYYGTLAGGWQRYFGYDDENQLTSAQAPGYGQSTFTYDGRGRLRKRVGHMWTGTASNWTPSSTNYYVYDGMRVIQERNAANVPTVAYTRGNDLSGSLEGAGGIGGLLARSHHSGQTVKHFYYYADGNGNVATLLNASQTVVAEYQYDSFGNLLSMRGVLAEGNLYRFSSKEYHPSSGLYYYGHRFYDPNLQRWLNRDPLGERGFEVLRGGRAGHVFANLYIFIGNSAISKIDPEGLKIWVCTVGAEKPFPKWSRHAYLWDDRKETKDKARECGKESSSGSDLNGNSSNNIGPSIGETANPWNGIGQKGATECYQVDDSEGKESDVMKCCSKDGGGYKMNSGAFVPYANDCHDAVDNCLKNHGLSSPPHSRGDSLSNHCKNIQCEMNGN